MKNIASLKQTVKIFFAIMSFWKRRQFVIAVSANDFSEGRSLFECVFCRPTVQIKERSNIYKRHVLNIRLVMIDKTMVALMSYINILVEFVNHLIGGIHQRF